MPKSGGSGFTIRTGDLHQSGSQLTNFGDQLSSGGQKLESIGNSLVSHANGDKSGVGKIIAKALGTGTNVVGKVFSEGGRVASGSGKRLHATADNHAANESSIASSINKITNPGGKNANPSHNPAGSGGHSASGSGGPTPAKPPTPKPASGGGHGGGTGGSTGPVAAPPKPHSAGAGGKSPVAESTPPPNRTAGGDPVDVVTGEMFMDQEDLVLPGVLPVVLERTYVSGYRAGRWFGREWASTLDQYVQVEADAIRYVGADGVILHYPIPDDADQLVVPSHGARWPLRWNRETDTILVGRPESGLTFAFPPTDAAIRPLTAVADRNGNGMTLHRDDDGVPVELRHSGGYHVRFGHVDTADGPRVADLRMVRYDGAELTVRSFGYDALGRLDRVADSQGRPLVFEYDEQDRVVAWTDRVGQTYRYVYDESGRVMRTEGTDNVLVCSFDYDLDGQVTTLTDSLGHETRYYWNQLNQVTRTVDPHGGETRREYSRSGLPVSMTDPVGLTATTAPTGTGRVLRETAPDGTTLDVEYDTEWLPVRVTGSDQTTWTMDYDDRGNVLAEHGPGGMSRSYAYDESGALSALTNELGQTTHFRNDAAGLPMVVTEPSGATSWLERDPFGRIVAEHDPLGGVIRTGWTVEGYLAWRVDSAGARDEWEHDAEGNVLLHRTPTGAETRYEYGPFGEIIARVDPTGARYTYAYDTEMRLRTVTTATGLTWEYEWDGNGNIIAEKDFDGVRQTREYDAAGRLVRRVNGVGQWATYQYDQFGRLAEQRTEHSVYTHTYDPAGRVVSVSGPGHVLEYSYDESGRTVTESLNGRATSYAYDAVGRMVSRKTPSGAVSAWTYDAAGQPVTLTAAGGTLAFEHDADGRETARRFGAGITVRQGFDPVGRLASQTVRTEAGALQRRAYTYRADGQPVQITDHIRGARNYELDDAGQVTAVRGAGWTESYRYDLNGNLVHAETPTGRGPAQRRATGTLVHEAGDTTFDHDAQGRVVRATQRTPSGVLQWTYLWDAEDRLITVQTPDGSTWHYLYDAFGRRIAKRCLDRQGRTVSETWFTWEGTRLAEQVVSVGSQSDITTWDWQPGTHRVVAQSRHGARFDQDQVDIAFHAIVTDLVGTPTELVAPDGRIAWHATELWGSGASRPVGQADFPLRFPGQYHDSETGLHYNLHRYYNPRTAAYLTSDPLGLNPAPNSHAYVDNPLSYLDPLGLTPTCLKGITQKLGSLNPFRKKQTAPTGRPSVPYTPPAEKPPVPATLYRWEGRGPAEIANAGGFHAWNPAANNPLKEHVLHPEMRDQWVSTSAWSGTGTQIGTSKPYFYKIDSSKLPDPNALHDVNHQLGPHQWQDQQEHAHAGTIPTSAITHWATKNEAAPVVYGAGAMNKVPPTDTIQWQPFPPTPSSAHAVAPAPVAGSSAVGP